MFGRITVTPIVQIGAGANLQVAITTLLREADQPEIARWIEFPAVVLLFLFVPGDPESGAAYVLDRKKGTWYLIDFEDDQFGGYSVSQLDQLLRECRFLDLLERPALWQRGLRWCSRLQGQEAIAEVAIVSENDRQYHVLHGLREAKR